MAATEVTMRVWRGDAKGGAFVEYRVPSQEGMVVLDVIHTLQATQAGDLACRWNCKAGKCGSCSAEINGKPRLMCMTRMDTFTPGETITVAPMKTFPIYRDLATDVSFNYEKAKTIPAFKPRAKEPDGTRRMYQEDVERSQEFRKCIECFMCQDVCHVIRDHPENKTAFAGPRYLDAPGRARDAPARHPRPQGADQAQGGARLLQHHQVLHRGLPRAHPHHGQCPDPAQRAHRHRVPRPRGVGVAEAHGALSRR